MEDQKTNNYREIIMKCKYQISAQNKDEREIISEISKERRQYASSQYQY